MALTDEIVNQQLQQHFDTTGRRPTQRTHTSIENWLRKQHSSISQRCDALGLPSVYTTVRSDASINKQLQDYFKATGKAPSSRSHNTIDKWLQRNKGTSLAERCWELGLPNQFEHSVLNRTLEEVDQELLTFYKKHGIRPTQDTHTALDSWLKYHNHGSIGTRCTVLGIPTKGVAVNKKALAKKLIFIAKLLQAADSSKVWTVGLDLSKLNQQVDRQGLSKALEGLAKHFGCEKAIAFTGSKSAQVEFNNLQHAESFAEQVEQIFSLSAAIIHPVSS